MAFCLVLQLSSVAHFLIVRHEACAEHGEIAHVGTVDLPRLAGQSLRSEVLAKVVEVRGGHSGGGHEHCPLVSDRAGQTVLVPNSVQNIAELRLSGSGRPHTTAVCLSPNALQLLAPKTSPPV